MCVDGRAFTLHGEYMLDTLSALVGGRIKQQGCCVPHSIAVVVFLVGVASRCRVLVSRGGCSGFSSVRATRHPGWPLREPVSEIDVDVASRPGGVARRCEDHHDPGHFSSSWGKLRRREA